MKKTIKKRAFISAIAMLIVSAIVLTSSTFAWFSMAKTGTVDMDLTIASPDGIQISANTSAFTTSLTMADFKGESGSRYAAYTDNINNFPENLSPVSSAMNCTSGLPKFYSGAIDDNGKCDVSLVLSDAGSNYVAFDLFISLASATNVSIANSTIECKDNSEVLTAMRIATVNCGLVSKGADATEIQNKKPTAQFVSSTNVAQMIEPDSAKHTALATERGATGYVSTYYMTSTKNKVVCDTTYPNIVPSGLGGSAGTSAASDGTIKALAGVNRIRVYIWMEGQDVDCANDVAGAALKVNLKFDI